MPATDDFSPVATAREVLRRARVATLSTLARRTGHPFGSLVSIACAADGTPILLMSTLAAHSRNLADDSRASLLVADAGPGDPQRLPRLTVVGRIEPVAEPAAVARRYLARHPEAALYAGFADFAWYRLVVEDAHLVAGFGRAMRVRGEDLLLDVSAAADLIAAEPEILARLAADPARLAALAERSGAGPGDWRAVGVDPEGLDLATGDPAQRRFTRLSWPNPANDREMLVDVLTDWENTAPPQEMSQID